MKRCHNWNANVDVAFTEANFWLWDMKISGTEDFTFYFEIFIQDYNCFYIFNDSFLLFIFSHSPILSWHRRISSCSLTTCMKSEERKKTFAILQPFHFPGLLTSSGSQGIYIKCLSHIKTILEPKFPKLTK